MSIKNLESSLDKYYQKINVDTVRARNGIFDNLDIPTSGELEVDRIKEKTFGANVTFDSLIDADNGLISSFINTPIILNTSGALSLTFPQANILDSEYLKVEFNGNASGTSSDWNLNTIVNEGTTYCGQSNTTTNDIVFSFPGIYLIKIKLIISSNFPTSDSIEYIFSNTTDPFAEAVSLIANGNNNAGTSHILSSYLIISDSDVGDSYKLSIKVIRGLGLYGYGGNCSVTRIK